MAKASHADVEDFILRRKAKKEGKTSKLSKNGHAPGLLTPSSAVELPMNLTAYFNENGFCLLQGDCRELLGAVPRKSFRHGVRRSALHAFQ